ncbi:MAG: lipase family protein [Proteobacteria bacterium]|nr:lipase family protein [Pseudomonadota bacterium]
MSHILVNSKQQQEVISSLLQKGVPSYRQAYSDRTAWLMACMSELAYIRFNPLLIDVNLNCLIKKISDLGVNSVDVKNFQTIVSAINYDHEAEKKKLEQELEQLECKLVQTFDNEGTQAILVSNKQCIILAFRGTEATSIKDIKSDAKAVSKADEDGGKIHSGFDEAYQKIAFDVEKALNADDNKEKPLFITGHSLGGALATIAAKKITHKAGNAACYTFGAPRVGDEAWVSNIKTPLYRVVNAADCVTMLPPSSEMVTVIGWILGLTPHVGKIVRTWILAKFGGYLHGGDMRYITNCARGNYKEVKLLYSVSWFYRVKALIVKKLPWKKTLLDHSIIVYRKKLLIIAQNRT